MAATGKKVPSGGPESGKKTVVIADDEPIIVMNLQEMLEDQGFDVVATAEDGFGAINACRQYHPDVLLLDIQMPVLDGLAVAKYVHMDDLADTVIVISAFSDPGFVTNAGANGVSGYLVKPIDTATLLSTIHIAMMRSKELQSLRKEVQKVTHDMESRKKIEQAKGILMKKQSLGEQEAFNLIREISRSRAMSMETVAEIILCGEK